MLSLICLLQSLGKALPLQLRPPYNDVEDNKIFDFFKGSVLFLEDFGKKYVFLTVFTDFCRRFFQNRIQRTEIQVLPEIYCYSVKKKDHSKVKVGGSGPHPHPILLHFL